jgi:hypothetical protein
MDLCIFVSRFSYIDLLICPTSNLLAGQRRTNSYIIKLNKPHKIFFFAANFFLFTKILCGSVSLRYSIEFEARHGRRPPKTSRTRDVADVVYLQWHCNGRNGATPCNAETKSDRYILWVA